MGEITDQIYFVRALRAYQVFHSAMRSRKKFKFDIHLRSAEGLRLWAKTHRTQPITAVKLQACFDVIGTLNPREQSVIKMRCGLCGEHHTFEFIGNFFQVTRERIRQIEAKAFRKLNHPSRRNRL